MIPFEDIAARIIAIRDSSVAARVKVIQKLAPSVTMQVERDRGPRGPMIFWGNSSNVDELAHTEIVDPAVLIPLLHVAGQPLNPVTPHAGVQHTYGYLFSTIDTPFGKKRDRWTSNALERALGLHKDTLSPVPRIGTLLANATWVAGQIAFGGSSRAAWLERCLHSRVSPELLPIEWARKPGWRMIETVIISRTSKSVHLFTDLVQLQRPAILRQAESPMWLLVYSIQNEQARWSKLITMFTVTEEFVAEVQEKARVRKRTDIRLRFNATVPGLPTRELPGTVKLIRRKP